MKKRMRYYIRQKWAIIPLPVNADKPYHSARHWCEQHFEKNNWAASLHGTAGDARFAFKREQDATLFSLRWL